MAWLSEAAEQQEMLTKLSETFAKTLGKDPLIMLGAKEIQDPMLALAPVRPLRSVPAPVSEET